MYLDLNPGALGIDANNHFPALVKETARAGFVGIDFPTQAVTSVNQAVELRKLIADAGLRWGMCPLPADFLRGTEEQFEEGLKKLEALLPLAEAAGCERAYNHVWPGSNEYAFEENWAWHVRRLERLAKRLRESGIRLGLEFIGPATLQAAFSHPFIRTPFETAKLIRSVQVKMGLVIDCFHVYTSGVSLDDLWKAVDGLEVISVHVNDAVAGRARDEQLDLERALPLETGLVDVLGIMQLVARQGSDCPVFAEPFEPSKSRLRQLPPTEVVAEVGTLLQRVFRDANAGKPS